MGSYTECSENRNFEEAYDGPTVSAANGHFLLDERFPDVDPSPILAWKIGAQAVLAVTADGCKIGEFFVLYPNGAVRPHFLGYGSAIPSFKSLKEWRSFVSAQAQKIVASEPKTDLARYPWRNRADLRDGLRPAYPCCGVELPLDEMSDEDFEGNIELLLAQALKLQREARDLRIFWRGPAYIGRGRSPLLNETGHHALSEAGF